MTIHLPEDLERYLHDQVQAGMYSSADEVIRDALDCHRQARQPPASHPSCRRKSPTRRCSAACWKPASSARSSPRPGSYLIVSAFLRCPSSASRGCGNWDAAGAGTGTQCAVQRCRSSVGANPKEKGDGDNYCFLGRPLPPLTTPSPGSPHSASSGSRGGYQRPGDGDASPARSIGPARSHLVVKISPLSPGPGLWAPDPLPASLRRLRVATPRASRLR
jgi:hypothetical protein